MLKIFLNFFKPKSYTIGIRKRYLLILLLLSFAVKNYAAEAEEKTKEKIPPYRIAITLEGGANIDKSQLENSVGILGINAHHILRNGLMINTGAGLALGKDGRYGGHAALGLGYYKTIIDLNKPVKKLKSLGFGFSFDTRLGAINKNFTWSFQPTVYFRYNKQIYGLYLGLADTEYKSFAKNIDITIGLRAGIFLF